MQGLSEQLLTEEEGDAVAVIRPTAASAVLLVCEHASRRLPQRFGDLGLSAEARASHIAWDPGALATAEIMADNLDATLIHQRFSRLIYDCNRPPEAPGAMPETSEVYSIPGNHGIDVGERKARTEALYLPFHAKIAATIAARQAGGQPTVLVTMHSFTPVYMGQRRDVEIGLLHDADSRLVDTMLAQVGDTYTVRRNEPYGPADGVTHTLVKHALPHGLLNVMIEVRNDLLTDKAGQEAMAGFLTGLLQQSLAAL